MECDISRNALFDYWRSILKTKMSIVCFKEGSNEMAAVNLMFVSENKPEDPENRKFDGFAMQQLKTFYDFYGDTATSPFKVHNVDSYLSAVGLGVTKKYRYRGIAVEMLKARFVINSHTVIYVFLFNIIFICCYLEFPCCTLLD